MTSHVEQQIAERIARVRAEEERKRQQRQELAEARRYGLEARRRAKLRNLARSQQDPAVATDNVSAANDSLDNQSLAASGAH